MGRKMQIWERRLMSDFHVSPAMVNVSEAEKTAVKEVEISNNRIL